MASQFQPDPHQPPSGYAVNDRGRCVEAGVTDDDKTWAMLAHLSLLAHLLLPIVAIAAPIVIYAARRERSAFVGDHAREAINFQITLIIYHLIAIPLAIITCGIGAVLVPIAYILGLIGMVMAALAANRREYFRYPMTFRLVG
jgi:hypothetical protein